MAQLRDVQTGELLAEGTPIEMVLVADTLGHADTVFDDVGAINADTVRKSYQDELAGLQAAAKKAKAGSDDRASLDAAVAARKEIATSARRLAAQARRAQTEARARAS